MILETIPAIQSLTVDQKLRLVWELWNDVSKNTTLTPEAGALLNERLAEYEANPDAVRTTDEVTAGIMRIKQTIAKSRA
jgi:putative addiction module component (TIGR02574 family)